MISAISTAWPHQREQRPVQSECSEIQSMTSSIPMSIKILSESMRKNKLRGFSYQWKSSLNRKGLRKTLLKSETINCKLFKRKISRINKKCLLLNQKKEKYTIRQDKLSIWLKNSEKNVLKENLIEKLPSTNIHTIKPTKRDSLEQ